MFGVAFYHAVMRPVWDQLERPGAAARVWQASRRRFASFVLGPHFEHICRQWALDHADPGLLGGLPASVGHGVITDQSTHSKHEVDVAVVGIPDGATSAPLLAIGEAKWNDVMGIGHLERLERIRALITRLGNYDTSSTRLLLCSGAGFNDRLCARARETDDVVLIGLDELYGRNA